LTDEKKFLYLFQCEEYDIVEIIVRGVNEMYNRRNELIDNFSFIKLHMYMFEAHASLTTFGMRRWYIFNMF
jgi:hypothetical protein